MRWLVLLAVVACSDQAYIVVKVDRRPAVHGVATLSIEVTNGGAMRAEKLSLGGHPSFPVTFSLSAAGRSGDFAVKVNALDGSELLAGVGTTTTQLGATASVLLEPADFVINTDFAGDQFLSDDFEAIGFQLAATTDGSWIAGYRDGCPTNMCTLYARRFDRTGAPLVSQIAAGTNGFPVSTTQTTFLSEPAAIATGPTTLVLWNFTDTVGTNVGVACRALDANGATSANQLAIVTDVSPNSLDVVSATTLSNANVAVTWSAFVGANPKQIRTAVIRPDCTTVAGPINVSLNAGAAQSRRPHLASNADKLLYVWTQDAGSGGDVHLRAATNAIASGMFTTGDTPFLTHSATDQIDFVRVAPLGNGFAIVTRWGQKSGMGPGRIALYRTTATGAMIGTPTILTDKSGSDFASDKSFGVTTRADGALLVVWHVCGNADGTQCTVYGRVVRPSGVPVGDPFVVPTTLVGDQTNPSATALPDAFVVGWHDTSNQAPDMQGGAVRARVIYPPYDDAQGVLGAACGGTGNAACGAGLACGTGSDGAARCYEVCDSGAAPPICARGGTCSTITGGNACTF